MANYRRTATGNWSNLAQWEDDGGGSYAASTVLPGPGDVAYANNFTVTLDIDVVVDEVRTDAGTNVNAGGGFTFGAGNSLTANVFAGSTTCVTNSTANTKTITGDITGGNVAGSNCVVNNSNGTLIINGNIIGGTGSNASGVRNNSSGLVIINGNTTGGTNANAWGTVNTSSGTLIINGVVTGGSGGLAHGANNFDAGTMTINGVATGGSGGSSYGANNNTSGTMTINGVATGGTGGGSSGAWNNSTGTLRVTTAQGNDNNAGVNGSNIAGTTIVSNVVWSNNGRIPLTGFVKFDNTASKSIQVVLENNTTTTLVDPSTGFPTETDVRDGVSYASGALTGSLVVPSANTVSIGVVYDNGTVGTLESLNAAAFLSELSSSSDPLAVRLQNVVTTDILGAQIAAYTP